jgi:hypothetical protein
VRAGVHFFPILAKFTFGKVVRVLQRSTEKIAALGVVRLSHPDSDSDVSLFVLVRIDKAVQILTLASMAAKARETLTALT